MSNSTSSNALTLIRPTAVLLGVMTVLCGAVYPALTTVVARTLFPSQATGSILSVDGQAVGSQLVGQEFLGAGDLWGRPSATAEHAYNTRLSAGSNLGPASPVLDSLVSARVAEVRAREGLPPTARIPGDLVLASGSGLDPHISPAAAAIQIPRIASARGIAQDSVASIIAGVTEGRQGGLLGEPRVNVLQANLLLRGLRSQLVEVR